MVFAGPAHTNSTEITFATNAWTMFGWPYNTRLESEGTDRGWGFFSAGGTTNYTWRDADNLAGEYEGSSFMIYLGTNGGWFAIGTQTPADVALEPGKAYYYYHRGSSAMQWTAPKD